MEITIESPKKFKCKEVLDSLCPTDLHIPEKDNTFGFSALGCSYARPEAGWEVGGAEGGWGTSFSPYICSTRVLFYHLTYLVYLTVRHEHMTLPRGRLC